MQSYSLAHVTDAILLRDLSYLVSRDRLTTAMLLAHIAEVDARRLFVPAGYPSMHAYCVDELRLSEDAASKRIQELGRPGDSLSSSRRSRKAGSI